MGGFPRAAPEFGTQVSSMFDTSDNLSLNGQIEDSHARLVLFKRKPEYDYRTYWQIEDEDEGQVDNGNCKEDEKEEDEESRNTLISQKKNNKLEVTSRALLWYNCDAWKWANQRIYRKRN